MKTTPKRAPKAKLLLPEASLVDCVFGAFLRDIRQCDLSVEQRFNYFASSPLCAITWVFSGQTHLLTERGQMRTPREAQPFPRLAFSGPYSTPQTSWSEGEFHAMTLAFYPDAFAAISGVDVSRYANKTVSLEDVLEWELLAIAEDILASKDAEAGFEKLETALAEIWKSARPKNPVFGHLVSDWFKSLALRAAMSGPGKSVRQIERRFKRWTGHSRRRLLAYSKSEKAFEYALRAKGDGRLNLADMSVDLGYSDQSHMGRQVKEITGFSPREFMERYESDEAFWSFRLMGQKF
ncbi:MAG: AraC family transcriptional regulator [Rhizobiaceae bacterium]|nr:AraC family transcriptional regulator [Rhizobiaceae bacterium]